MYIARYNSKGKFILCSCKGGFYIVSLMWGLVVTVGEGSDGVGSVSGGGRYDELVGMFSPKGKVTGWMDYVSVPFIPSL